MLVGVCPGTHKHTNWSPRCGHNPKKGGGGGLRNGRRPKKGDIRNLSCKKGLRTKGGS